MKLATYLALIATFLFMSCSEQDRKPQVTETATVQHDTVSVNQTTDQKEPKKLLTAAVYLSKMQVLYIGVDNPLKITVPGVDQKLIQVELDGGSITSEGNKGYYTINVTKPGEVHLKVFLNNPDGSKELIERMYFRVKRVPDPKAWVGNSMGGNMQTGAFKAQQGIIAVMDNFDFEFKFTIQSYEMTYIAKRQDPRVIKAMGPRFNQKMLALIRNAKPGDIFMFDEIRVEGEDGTTRKIPGIFFKLI